MDSIGERLRLERLRQGRELEQVAQQTRINPRHLEAIENDDLANVPGKFFYRSFVRQYARTLGLDEHELENEFPEALQRVERNEETFAERPGREPIDVPPMPAAGRGRSNPSALPVSLILLVAVIIAASGVYSLWQRIQAGADAVPAAQEEPVRPPVAQTPAPAAAPVAAGAVDPAASAAALPDGAAQPVADTALNAAFAPVEPAPPGNGVLQILATGEVWISVVADGNTLINRTLQPNDARTITVPHGARMVLGNAGGVAVRWNGQPVAPLGPSGQVRSFVLGPEGPRGPSASAPQQAPGMDGAARTASAPAAAAGAPASTQAPATAAPAAPKPPARPKLVPTQPEM
jgi:cytoskeleton protein RodZ